MSIPFLCIAASTLAVVVGALVQGPQGWGVACGGLLGAAVAGSTAAALRRVARAAPNKAFNVYVVGFMVKLGVLMAIGLAYFLHEPLRDRLDPRGLLLAYVAAAVIVLAGGVRAARRELREGAARSETRA